mgnify:CR=1 FL=1
MFLACSSYFIYFFNNKFYITHTRNKTRGLMLHHLARELRFCVSAVDRPATVRWNTGSIFMFHFSHGFMSYFYHLNDFARIVMGFLHSRDFC